MNIGKLFVFTIISFLSFLNFMFASVVMDEKQVTTTLFEKTETMGKYVSTIEFYESSAFIETENKITTLDYTIMLPINILVEKASYKVADGYKIVEESATDEDYNGIKYGFIRIKIEKTKLKENESILTEAKQKVLTLYLTSNQTDLCSSKLNVKTQKLVTDTSKNTLLISVVIQKNAINVQQNFIIGFDNKNSKLMGVYYDKNSKYVEVPISIFRDRCSSFDQTIYAFNSIDGMINIPYGYSIESVTVTNPNVSEITIDKESGSFLLEYKMDNDSRKYIYENPTGFIVKLKKEDDQILYEAATISISTYNISGIENGGGLFEYMIIPGTLGDWNLDEKINLNDLIEARKYFVANDDSLENYALTGLENVDKDDKMSLLDLIELRRILVKS